MNLNKISLVGLGKLGLPLLTTFAKNGQKILGFDIDKNKISKLKDREIPFFEPNLQESLIEGYENITISYNIEDVVTQSDIAIVLVNTPSTTDGSFSNEYVFDVFTNISKEIKKQNKENFLFILSSTVMPSTCKKLISIVENNTSLIYNKNFGIVYIPDLVALGTVIKDFENPDLLILGQSNEYFGNIGMEIYKKIIKNNCPIVRMSLEEAEITKISLNAFITMKISFANFLGNICEIVGCNVSNVTKALGYDKRISPYFLNSGTSFGGTCFPRDTWAFMKFSESIGLDACHIKATQKINEFQNQNLLDKAKKYKDKKIGVVGIAFKPNTEVTVESSGYILYTELKKLGYDVIGYDSIIEDFSHVDLQTFINSCDVLVLTHNDKNLREKDFSKKVIIDPWNIIN